MVDYTRSTGSSATMMIRDTGSVVEFWLNSNNGSTWSDHIPWGYTANGVTHNGSYSYPAGAGWRKLGQQNVTYNQTVQFRLGSTGTGGFGGPTTFNQAISRATVPPAPNAPTFTNVTSDEMDVSFTDNGTGGSVIYVWKFVYGTDPTGAVATTVNSKTAHLTGLTPGATYYFWAQGQNAQGWGPWSARSQVTMLNVPNAPSITFVRNISQTKATVEFASNGDGGTAIFEYEIGYGTSPSAPTESVTAISPQLIEDLEPGTSYYFFVRAWNNEGWSEWSSPTPVRTVAGAKVKVGAVWKDAVPYVKVSGVWKLAQPWVKILGEWKETT